MKYKRMIATIKKRIADGNYREGECLPSIPGLEKEFGVSSRTVRRAIGELHAENVLHVIHGKGIFVPRKGADQAIDHYIISGYTDRSDSRRASEYMVPDLRRAAAIRSWGEQRGISFEEITVDAFLNADVVGARVIIKAWILSNNPQILEKLQGNAVVAIASLVDDLPVPTVSIDLSSGVRRIVAHLNSLGHNRIAYIGEFASASSACKFSSFIKATARKDPIGPEWMFRGAKHDREQIIDSFEQILAIPEITAVFVDTDRAAIHILNYCRDQGVKVPDRISIAAMDNLPQSALSDPPLTTLDLKENEQGIAACELLTQNSFLKRSRERVIVPSQLIVRSSTGAI